MKYRYSHYLVLLHGLAAARSVQAFAPLLPVSVSTTTTVRSVMTTTTTTRTRTTELAMGKSISKQAELRRKMELAKQQKQQQQQQQGGEGTNQELQSTNNNDKDDKKNHPTSSSSQLSDQEIKERNDRKRFEELLKQSTASAVWNDYAAADDYQNAEQLQAEIDAQRAGVERLFEGDPAPVDCFANLVVPMSPSSSSSSSSSSDGTLLGKAGTERLLPWLGKIPNDSDYLVILCDPRPSSTDLHTAVRHLWSDCPANVRQRLVVINADRPSQNRKWFKKQGWTTTTTTGTPSANAPVVYCDEKMEWMRAYTALGDKRWSMTLFILAGGRVQKLVRDVDVYTISSVVPKAIEAFRQAKL